MRDQRYAHVHQQRAAISDRLEASQAMIIRRSAATTLACALVFLSGCAQTVLEIRPEAHFTGPVEINVGTCIDRTGTATRDLAADATAAFRKRLAAVPEFKVKESGRFDLMCEVTAYAEGSAIKRWLLPGWGATTGQVAAMITDRETGQTIFTARSSADVSSGGLYTLGAETYILDAAVADLVAQMQKAVAERQAIQASAPAPTAPPK